LRYLEKLQGSAELEELFIKDENDLVLKDKDFILQLPELRKLSLINIKQIEGSFLKNLPENLTDLILEGTPIQPGDLFLNKGIAKLVNVTLTNCQLRNFALEPPHNLEIVYLNLSGNALVSLNISFHDGPSTLTTLDLSRNKLEHLNFTWFYRTTRKPSKMP